MPPTSDDDPVVCDFVTHVRRGCRMGCELLTAGEIVVARRMLALPADVAALYARLCARKPLVFRMEDLDYSARFDAHQAAIGLCEQGFADRLVAWADRRNAWDGTWIRIRHRALLLRLTRWATFHRRPDPSLPVRTRLGHLRWADYPTTTPPRLHACRRRLLAWEATLAPSLSAAHALRALRAQDGRAPGALSTTHDLIRRVHDLARRHEQDGEVDDAALLYRELTDARPETLGSVAPRWALALERAGRDAEALDVLRRARPVARSDQLLAIHRTARRLAKRRGETVAPPAPLRQPQARALRLRRATSATPPKLWHTESGAATVEHAVVDHLRQAGRTATFGEGRLWSTLAALLLADVMFAPVEGALPVPRLPRPVDRYAPGFVARRGPLIERLLARLGSDEGTTILNDAWVRWHGRELAGAHWPATSCDEMLSLANALSPQGLIALARHVLHDGRGATSGLPDLIVWPGNPAEIAGLHPKRIPGHLLAIEIKAPGDSVRDAQAVWMDRLLGWGVDTHLWRVSPTGPSLC